MGDIIYTQKSNSFYLPASDTGEELEDLRLPSGGNIPGVLDDGYDRGFGKEHIIKTLGINDVGDVKHVVKFPDVIGYNEEYTVVNGDTGDGNHVILYVAEGLVLHAETTVPNPPGHKVIPGENLVINIDKGQLKDHNEKRQEDHYVKEEPVKRIINNADEIYTNNHGLYYYVLYENGKAKIAHVFNRAREGGSKVDVYTVSTAYDTSISDWDTMVNNKGLDRIWTRK